MKKAVFFFGCAVLVFTACFKERAMPSGKYISRIIDTASTDGYASRIFTYNDDGSLNTFINYYSPDGNTGWQITAAEFLHYAFRHLSSTAIGKTAIKADADSTGYCTYDTLSRLQKIIHSTGVFDSLVYNENGRIAVVYHPFGEGADSLVWSVNGNLLQKITGSVPGNIAATAIKRETFSYDEHPNFLRLLNADTAFYLNATTFKPEQLSANNCAGIVQETAGIAGWQTEKIQINYTYGADGYARSSTTRFAGHSTSAAIEYNNR